jgi:L-ascorbate metabolism protein UlaG (beta-lactamase superfamily)
VALPAITYVGHATVLIEVAGTRVLTDPVLTSRLGILGRVGASVDPSHHAAVDLVLVSHLHQDHLHLPSLRRVGQEVRVVAPRGSGRFLARRGYHDVEEVVAGSTVVHGGVRVTATPALHDDRRWPRVGPRATPVGYVVEGDGSSTYFAGDTDLFPEMDLLAADVALLPVWGWGTGVGPGHLDPARAARALVALGSRYAVPIHWGTLFPHQLHRARPRLRHHLERPPYEFAEHAAALGVATEVLVTRPGELVAFGATAAPAPAGELPPARPDVAVAVA